jgi:protein TonB
MKVVTFLVAVVLSSALHALATLTLFLLWFFHVPPSVEAVPLLAYGDSSIEGLRVDAVALDPGTLRHGNDNTPGEVPKPEEKPEPPKPEPPPPKPEPEPKLPKPPEVEALPKQPDPNDPVIVPKETPAEKKPDKPANDAVAKTQGAPGGSRLPLGTPSLGGTVGSRNGVRMVGAARLEYPREAVLRGIEGRVILFLRISAEGTVTEARIDKSSGHRVLDDAALAHAWKLTFLPARENYRPVATTALYPVTYELTASR